MGNRKEGRWVIGREMGNRKGGRWVIGREGDGVYLATAVQVRIVILHVLL